MNIDNRYIKKNDDDPLGDWQWIRRVLIYNCENIDFDTKEFRNKFRQEMKKVLEIDRSDKQIKRIQERIQKEVYDSKKLNLAQYGLAFNYGGQINFIGETDFVKRSPFKEEHLPLLNSAVAMYKKYTRHLPHNYLKFMEKPTWSWGIWADWFLRQVGSKGIKPLDILIIGEYLNQRNFDRKIRYGWTDDEWKDIHSWIEHRPFEGGELEEAYQDGIFAGDIVPLKKLFETVDHGTYVVNSGGATSSHIERSTQVMDFRLITEGQVVKWGFKLIVELFMGLGESNVPDYWLPSQKRQNYIDWCKTINRPAVFYLSDKEVKI